MSPAKLRAAWKTANRLPGGSRIFGLLLGRAVPYSGSIGARVRVLEAGHARVDLPDRRAVRNHLQSVHAIALMNLGELTTGLSMMAGLPEGGRGIITELSMSYTKKARGTITCEAQVTLPTEPGDHSLVLEAPLLDSSGDEVARARAVWKIEVPA